MTIRMFVSNYFGFLTVLKEGNLLDIIRKYALTRKNISKSLHSISDFENLRANAIDRVECKSFTLTIFYIFETDETATNN